LASLKTVLIIDDDAYIRRVIELKLKKHGYGVITASNGADGLNLIESLKPDAVIMDLNMPRIDGETLCRVTEPLRKERGFLTIVLSSRVDPHDRHWLGQMVNTKFVEKPFSPSGLLACLSTYLDG
jgi:OmpR family response regulator RpaB